MILKLAICVIVTHYEYEVRYAFIFILLKDLRFKELQKKSFFF